MNIRPSPIAGTWYPHNRQVLARNLQGYLQRATVEPPPGKVWGVVAPHAGYTYSGEVAAYAFNCLSQGEPELVVVTSPYHRPHPAPLLTTAYAAYETPLGLVPVDVAAIEALDKVLQRRLGLGLTPLKSDKEHAVEIELPFLQQVLAEFRLLPVMIRDQRPHLAQALGQALAESLAGRALIFVASSDFSHFFPQAEACQLDQIVLDRLAAFDPAGVLAAQFDGVGLACGRAAIAATLWACQAFGANRVTILNHATSGAVSGDWEAVVGYGAAVIWQEGGS
jgi:hypothetical protein